MLLESNRKERGYIIYAGIDCHLSSTKVPAAGSTQFQFGFEMEIQLLCAWKEVHTLCNSDLILGALTELWKTSRTINLCAKMSWNLKHKLLKLWQTYGW